MEHGSADDAPGLCRGVGADTTVAYDQALIDPDYNSDGGEEVSRIWLYAQALREIMDRRGDPFAEDRLNLRDAVLRQLQTLGLFREVKLARAEGKSQTLDLYVLLFPGEGRTTPGSRISTTTSSGTRSHRASSRSGRKRSACCSGTASAPRAHGTSLSDRTTRPRRSSPTRRSGRTSPPIS